MQKLLKTASLLLLALASFADLSAAGLSFDFKDPKGVNNVQFNLDAPLEAIAGTGTGITGTVVFDPANPETTSGSIKLATASLSVGNSLMKDHMLSADWLDAAGHPEILFSADSLTDLKDQGGRLQGTVKGKLSLKGITRDVTAPVSLSYLPGKLGARINKPDVKGDLLVVRANFTIKRSDFGIMAGKYLDKVSDEIQLSLSLAGSVLR